jgi:hypothetical protein
MTALGLTARSVSRSPSHSARDPMLELTGVVKRFAGVAAVGDVWELVMCSIT